MSVDADQKLDRAALPIKRFALYGSPHSLARTSG
jgi:hypothetical protein